MHEHEELQTSREKRNAAAARGLINKAVLNILSGVYQRTRECILQGL